MEITRASEIPSQASEAMRLQFVATPETGAVECVMLRVVVSAGGAFPAHSHDHEEILYFLTGSGTYEVAGETGSVSPGDVIVIPAGALHAFEASEQLDAAGVLPAGTKTFAPMAPSCPDSQSLRAGQELAAAAPDK